MMTIAGINSERSDSDQHELRLDREHGTPMCCVLPPQSISNTFQRRYSQNIKDLHNNFLSQIRLLITNSEMSYDSYTQHMPTLQRTTFWSNYMSAIKGDIYFKCLPSKLNFQETWLQLIQRLLFARPHPSLSTDQQMLPCTTSSMVSQQKIFATKINCAFYNLSGGQRISSAPAISGHEMYKPLHTDIYGRGRGRCQFY